LHPFLFPGQWISHFQHTFSIGSKKGYHVARTLLADADSEHPSFYPEYVLSPSEIEQFKAVYQEGGMWITKPYGGSCGRGIFLSNSIDVSKLSEKLNVQRFIECQLLINDVKLDIRFYITIPMLNSLKIYNYHGGLIRLSTHN
jgi:hypothetical protein